MSRPTLIEQIVLRATKLAQEHGQRITDHGMQPDSFNPHIAKTLLEHWHSQQPIFLKGLLDADDANFAHDVWGIYRLERGFTPRFDLRYHS